jgi:hypothetical protein
MPPIQEGKQNPRPRYYQNVRTIARQTHDLTGYSVTMCKSGQTFNDLVNDPQYNMTSMIHPSRAKPPTSGPWSYVGPSSQADIPVNLVLDVPPVPIDELFQDALELSVGQRPQHGGREEDYYSDTECLAKRARSKIHTSSAVESP